MTPPALKRPNLPKPAFVDELTKRVAHVALVAHTRLYETTNGAIGQSFLGAPCLLLTTTGAKTGAKRTLPLGYAKTGVTYVLAASNAGSDRNPGWFANLVKNDQVDVQVGAERFSAKAAVLRRGDPDYDRLFGLINEGFGGRYYRYQEKTSRPIPLVVLTPAD